MLTDPLDITVMADRPIVLEPILYSLREQDGSWDSRALVEQICSGQVGLVILGYPLNEISQRFPPTVGRAVQETFVLDEQVPLAWPVAGMCWCVTLPRSAADEQVPLAGRSRYVLVRNSAARCS